MTKARKPKTFLAGKKVLWLNKIAEPLLRVIEAWCKLFAQWDQNNRKTFARNEIRKKTRRRTQSVILCSERKIDETLCNSPGWTTSMSARSWCSLLSLYHSDCPTWDFRAPLERPAARAAASWSPETRRTNGCVACCFLRLSLVHLMSLCETVSAFNSICYAKLAKIPLDSATFLCMNCHGCGHHSSITVLIQRDLLFFIVSFKLPQWKMFDVINTRIVACYLKGRFRC